MLDHELIRTIANVVSAAGIAIGATQLWLQRRMWLSNHQRSRAEKAIEVIRHFNSTITAQSAAVIKIVERLSIDDLRAMDNGHPFSISGSFANDVEAALTGFKASEKADKISLSSRQSYNLRHQALEVLNNIEIVCQAWKLDVVDRETLQTEIAFLHDENAAEPRTFMKAYRNIFGAEKFYPALYYYLEVINDSSKKIAAKPLFRIDQLFLRTQ